MLAIRNLSKNFGSKDLFLEASFTLFEKERLCLIAPNGSGKTTLIKMILGKDQDFEGSIDISPKLRILSIAQTLPDRDIALPLLEFVLSALPLYKEHKKLEGLQEQLQHQTPPSQELLEAYGEQLSLFERQGGFLYLYEAKQVLEGLGFNESKDFHRSLSTFSGGEVRRILLAQVLLQKPDLLILDEPTNHLDIKNILFLENYLKTYPRTLFFISHDTEFINNIATHTLTIENLTFVKTKGGYEEYLEELDSRKALYHKKLSQLQEEMARLRPLIEKFRAGSRSTQSKVMQQRLERLEKETSAFTVTQKNLKPLSFSFGPLEKPFDPVLKIHNFSFSIGSRTFFKDLSLNLARYEKVAILAPNGTGKSLLLSKIVQAFKEKIASIRFAQKVSLEVFWQEDPNWSQTLPHVTVGEHLYNIIGSSYDLPQYHQYTANFHLGWDRPLTSLSGGEMSKLRLLALLLKKPNFLILDEPTNHLDIVSNEGIGQILSHYPGTLLFVSHNREFLKKLQPSVYLLQDYRLIDQRGETWETIFKHLFEPPQTTDPPQHFDFSLLEKERKEREENLTRRKEYSKEEKLQLRALKKQLQEISSLITKEEASLQALLAKQASEEIYNDYKKAMEVQKECLEKEKVIEALYVQYLGLEEEKKLFEAL